MYYPSLFVTMSRVEGYRRNMYVFSVSAVLLCLALMLFILLYLQKKFARTCIYSTISLSYDSCTKRWLTNVATSPADLGRRIERVDGQVWLGVRPTRKFRVGYFGFRVSKNTTRN